MRTASFFYVRNELPVSTWVLLYIHFKQDLRQLRNWCWEALGPGDTKDRLWFLHLEKYFNWTSYLFQVFDPPRLLAMVTWMVDPLPGMLEEAANNEPSHPPYVNVALFWNTCALAILRVPAFMSLTGWSKGWQRGWGSRTGRAARCCSWVLRPGSSFPTRKTSLVGSSDELKFLQFTSNIWHEKVKRSSPNSMCSMLWVVCCNPWVILYISSSFVLSCFKLIALS